MSLNRKSQIAVVGGSLTGPTLALLMRRVGFENVNLFESTAADVSQGGGRIWLYFEGLDAVAYDREELVEVQHP